MSKNRIYSLNDLLDGACTTEQYTEQFETARDLKVGEIYRQSGAVYYIDYRIIFIGEGVALGVEIANGNNNFGTGKKELFNSEGPYAGWKYQDHRAEYRLKKRRLES